MVSLGSNLVFLDHVQAFTDGLVLSRSTQKLIMEGRVWKRGLRATMNR